MSTISYRKMTSLEFDNWSVESIEDYAKDLVKNHLYSFEHATVSARNNFMEELPEGINSASHHFRVLEKDEQAVGFLWYKLEDNEAFLCDIMIGPSSQSQGLGKILLNEFISEIKTTSATEIELRVSPDNHVAMKLYKDFGFRVTGYDMSLLLRDIPKPQ